MQGLKSKRNSLLLGILLFDAVSDKRKLCNLYKNDQEKYSSIYLRKVAWVSHNFVHIKFFNVLSYIQV